MEKGTKHIIPNGDDGDIHWYTMAKSEKSPEKRKKQVTGGIPLKCIIIIGQIPQIYHPFALIDPPKMGDLMTLVKMPSNYYGWSTYTPL